MWPVLRPEGRVRRPARAGASSRRCGPFRVLAAAPLLLLPTLFAAPVQAQSVLVSNADQQDADTPSIEQAAQPFTTGSNSSGYNLTSIVLNCSCQGYTSGTVTLHSGTRTGSKVADFTASVATDDLVLTPTETITLSANTTYVVLTGDNFDAGTTWFTTNSDSEDDGAAAAGWSIADDSQFYQTGTSSWVTSTGSYQLTVNGNALGITPTGLQLDAPSGTAGFLRVRWEAEPGSAEAYHVRARPTVDTETEEYVRKYLTGNRTVRVDAAARDYTFYMLVPGVTYRSQVCRVTAIHTLVHEGKTHSVPSFDTLGECSPWQSIALPSAANADRNDVEVTLEFPDGGETATLTPDTHGTLNYRVRLSGINDLSEYRNARAGAGSWILFLKPNVSTKTHRFGSRIRTGARVLQARRQGREPVAPDLGPPGHRLHRPDVRPDIDDAGEGAARRRAVRPPHRPQLRGSGDAAEVVRGLRGRDGRCRQSVPGRGGLGGLGGRSGGQLGRRHGRQRAPRRSDGDV